MRNALIITLVVPFLIPLPEKAFSKTPALTYKESVDDRDRRDKEIIIGWVRHFVKKNGCTLPKWTNRDNVQKAVMAIGAVLYVLANQSEFQNYQQYVDELLATCGPLSGPITPADYIRVKFWDYLKGAHVIDGVGTSDDFDMALLALSNLMYLFQYDTVSLPNDVVYAILCMNRCDVQFEPMWTIGCGYITAYDWQPDAGPYLAFDKRDFFTTCDKVTVTETENHVLMIYLWRLLATNWILWQGSLNPWDQRYDSGVAQWYNDHADTVYGDPEGYYDPMLQIFGRILHRGYYETNAKPYSKFSTAAVLTAAFYGSIPGMPDNVAPIADRVKQAATNAFNYSAAKFAFQSMRAKRQPPYRRRFEHASKMSFYDWDGIPVVYGVLSGSVEYDDCTDHSSRCRVFDYMKVEVHGYALWAALARLNSRTHVQYSHYSYELPEVIGGLMFHQEPYFARMQSRYTREHYRSIFAEARPYFVDEQNTYEGKDFRSSPELYFSNDELMLTAGGRHIPYYTGLFEPADSDFAARPTMLYSRGDFGHYYNEELNAERNDWEWHTEGADRPVDDAIADIHTVLMRGDRSYFCLLSRICG